LDTNLILKRSEREEEKEEERGRARLRMRLVWAAGSPVM